MTLGNDITTDIDIKHILFISTWVWDNLIEKYEMGSWPPHPNLQLISFCVLHAMFWTVLYVISWTIHNLILARGVDLDINKIAALHVIVVKHGCPQIVGKCPLPQIAHEIFIAIHSVVLFPLSVLWNCCPRRLCEKEKKRFQSPPTVNNEWSLRIIILQVGIVQLVSHRFSSWGSGFESRWGFDSGDPMHEWEGKRLPAVKVLLHQLAWRTGV